MCIMYIMREGSDMCIISLSGMGVIYFCKFLVVSNLVFYAQSPITVILGQINFWWSQQFMDSFPRLRV